MIPRFRAWNKKEKKMYYINSKFFITFAGDGTWSIERTNKKNTMSLVEVVNHKNGVLMQSTGLKDKNHKEIFEGDIVKAADYKTKFIIEWCNDSNMMAGFCGKSISAESKPKTDYYLPKGSHIEIQYLHPLEVVGTIYANPIFLKKHTKKKRIIDDDASDEEDDEDDSIMPSIGGFGGFGGGGSGGFGGGSTGGGGAGR